MKSDRIQAQFNLLNQFTLYLNPQLTSQAQALPKERGKVGTIKQELHLQYKPSLIPGQPHPGFHCK